MLEIPQKTFEAPPPLPLPVARPATPAVPIVEHQANAQGNPPPLPVGSARTDKVAIASTVCGLSAFIPVFSQIIGLFLGVWALFRIRRARRAGHNVRGTGWATAGITGNGFALLGWLALFASFAALKGTLSQTTSHLHPLLSKPAIAHLRVRK